MSFFDDTYSERCTLSLPFLWVNGAFLIIYMAISLKLSWSIRKINAELNESSQLMVTSLIIGIGNNKILSSPYDINDCAISSIFE